MILIKNSLEATDGTKPSGLPQTKQTPEEKREERRERARLRSDRRGNRIGEALKVSHKTISHDIAGGTNLSRPKGGLDLTRALAFTQQLQRELAEVARWRFALARNASPGQFQAEIGGYPGNVR